MSEKETVHTENIKNFAINVRKNILEMAVAAGASSAHFGGALSITEIISTLFAYKMKIDKKNPLWESRDRFILSKGHAGAAVYSVLAELDFFAVDKLKTHYQDGSDLSGHVSHKGIPGVELSTGSLGHGLNVGVGMAKAAKLDNLDHRIFVLLSDGECDEGTVWEAAMFSNHHKLDNLVAIIDYNKIQSLDSTENTLALEPFLDKWISFGWNVIEVDGHNHTDLNDSFNLINQYKNKPSVLIANTTKGKGVSFMENSVLWHYRSPQGKEFDDAIIELDSDFEG